MSNGQDPEPYMVYENELYIDSYFEFTIFRLLTFHEEREPLSMEFSQILHFEQSFLYDIVPYR